MTGLTYTTYTTQVAELAVVPVTDPDFQTILPQVINYAELRLQRDLDFLNTTTQYSYTATPNSQQLNFSGYPFVTIQNVGVADPISTYVKQCTPVTKEYIYSVYPIGSTATLPAFFSLFDDNSLLLGPIPDQAYTFYVTGTIRFPSLSASNPTTFISTYLPDIFVIASMIYISAYQRNFGNMQANDPQMGASYEAQYQLLLKGAMVEEARKKFEAGGWTSMSPAVAATPTRG
jgi:hypothetical protein